LAARLGRVPRRAGSGANALQLGGGALHLFHGRFGWPALCLLAWRVSRFLTKAETRVLTAENHITKMATNCFPTMQTSLQNQDGLLKSVDQSLKTLVLYHEHPTKKH